MPALPNGQKQSSVLGMGCAYLTEGLTLSTPARLVHAAYDAGARHFDVAPQYGRGTAEKVLGYALKDRRQSVTIASKVGIPRPSINRTKMIARALASPLRTYLKGNAPVVISSSSTHSSPSFRDFSLPFLEKSLPDTLRLLRTDYLDAYLLHMVRRKDVDETLVDYLVRCRSAGHVRAIGLATSRAETALILEDYPDVFDVVQYSWSVLDAPLNRPENVPFLITHRSLMRAYGPLRSWLRDQTEARTRLSEAVGEDLSDPNRLASVLIGAAISENPQGIALVASRDETRLRQNLGVAGDPTAIEAGARLATALLLESERPCPIE